MQLAAAKALNAYLEENPPKFLREMNNIYFRRAQLLFKGLNSLGIKCEMPKATFCIWAKCGGSSIDFVKKMLDVNVVALPGVGFECHGEGYVRFSVTCPEEKIEEACRRLKIVI